MTRAHAAEMQTVSSNSPAATARALEWQAPPLPKVAWGKGCYIYDTNGRQYIDGSAGPAVFSLGHAHEEVNAAIKDQLDRIAHGYRYTFTSDPLEELTSRVAASCGGGLKYMTFCSSGSEAVESCLKIALQYHVANGEISRHRFIARERSWHGNTLGALAISGFLDRRHAFEGALVPASLLSAANAYRPPADISANASPAEVAKACAAQLEAEILRCGPETIAAFIFEPVVGAAGGCVPAPPGYAKMVREICNRHGVLMIADEVMCGSGRCGTWRALETDGVEPDIMSVAKGLAGGYIPLSAAIYHERLRGPIFEAHGGLMTGHTFTGHTAACAAGVAVQQVIARDHLLQNVTEMGHYLRELLQAELGDRLYIGDIRGRGLFQGVELVQDRQSKLPFAPDLKLHARLRDRAFENGLICYPVGGNVDGRQGDIIILSPPYIVSRAEIEEIVDKLQRSLSSVMGDVTVSS